VDFRQDTTEGEEVLGLGSASRVWRVGDTIRRSRWPSSDTTAALLRHLELRGFRYSPRYLGVDGLGRDVLSLLPGVPVPTLRGDDQLVQVATLLRELHDATADFTAPADAAWQVEPVPAAPGGGRIIHRDIAAWNLLETGGVISGLADWDLAGPGRLIEDFAYAAWHFTPLHPELMGDGSGARLSPTGRGACVSWLTLTG
jgi:Phosphotransferase enzyme family